MSYTYTVWYIYLPNNIISQPALDSQHRHLKLKEVNKHFIIAILKWGTFCASTKWNFIFSRYDKGKTSSPRACLYIHPTVYSYRWFSCKSSILVNEFFFWRFSDERGLNSRQICILGLNNFCSGTHYCRWIALTALSSHNLLLFCGNS